MTISRTNGSSNAQVSWSPVRTVPVSMPVCGMALGAWPATTAPHTMTVLVRGSTRLLNIPGRPVMTVPNA